jgi:DNA-binding transcriptional ArsR family regulator
MVEHNLMPTNSLDSVFGSLADATRRDILRLVAGCELSIGEIASHYNLTFAAISKHIKILEKAKLVVKRRRGKEQMVTLAPKAFHDAEEYLRWYQRHMEERFDRLDKFLQSNK